MIEILCFGDSNTYGFTPDWKHRYGRDIRYPGVLQALLGDGYYVAEDGLIGRTAAFPDSNRDGRSALDTLPLSIESHGPVQYIVLMLGTNDCKADKTRSAEEVGIGMTSSSGSSSACCPHGRRSCSCARRRSVRPRRSATRNLTRSRSPCRRAWQSSTA